MKTFLHRIYLFFNGHRHSYYRELDVTNVPVWPFKHPHAKVCGCGKVKIVERV